MDLLLFCKTFESFFCWKEDLVMLSWEFFVPYFSIIAS